MCTVVIDALTPPDLVSRIKCIKITLYPGSSLKYVKALFLAGRILSAGVSWIDRGQGWLTNDADGWNTIDNDIRFELTT